MDILEPERRKLKSRDREVFGALIQLHSQNEDLLANLSDVIRYMCSLQPAEFVMVSFSVELERFVRDKRARSSQKTDKSARSQSDELRFASCFVQHMNDVLLNAPEAKTLRDTLKDSIGGKGSRNSERDRHRSRLFHILLHSFAHSLAASISLCLWGGAYRTAYLFLSRPNALDIHLTFLLEIDRLVETLERPLFRHLHIRMLEHDDAEGSGTMLFQALKSILMILPQSTCYRVLKDRLVSASRYRQSARPRSGVVTPPNGDTELLVRRVLQVRALHCEVAWERIRAGSLETSTREESTVDLEATRRSWVGRSDNESSKRTTFAMELKEGYQDLKDEKWKLYWEGNELTVDDPAA